MCDISICIYEYMYACVYIHMYVFIWTCSKLTINLKVNKRNMLIKILNSLRETKVLIE